MKKIGFILIILVLCSVTVVLASLALVLGNQMVGAQRKVHDLQNQIASYENMTNILQTQANNLEAQIYELQNPIDNVTIIAISVGPWHPDPLTGYPYYKDINITVQNVGTRNIGGATLDFNVEGNTTNTALYMAVSGQYGILHVQESKNLGVHLVTGKDQTPAFFNSTLTITLMLDKYILDRQTVSMANMYDKYVLEGQTITMGR